MKRKYNLDESYFSKIDTNQKAYLLGLLYADGNNNEKNNTITLYFQEKDKHILEEIKILLKTNIPLQIIKPRKETHQVGYKLVITSSKMSKDLSKHGVISNKTFFLTFPNIEETLISHFIRGYFDGDGCIINLKGRERVSLVGTDLLLDKIQDIFYEKLLIKKTIRYKRNKEKNISTCYYKGKLLCQKIKEFLYRNSTIHFHRKYEKFMSL